MDTIQGMRHGNAYITTNVGQVLALTEYLIHELQPNEHLSIKNNGGIYAVTIVPIVRVEENGGQ